LRCEPIRNDTGPFANCQAMGETAINILYQQCVFDYCTNNDNDNYCRVSPTLFTLWIRVFSAQILDQFVHKCQTRLPGTHLGDTDWRPYVGCLPLICPVYDNQQYDSCGTSCPDTCTFNASATNCTLPCYEGCRCANGYVLDNFEDGMHCVDAASCKGCLDLDGNSHNCSFNLK
jgi:hypothetical protein